MKDPETKASLSKAARRGLGKSKGGKKDDGGDCIHLDDKTLPGLPERTTVDIEQKNTDEDAFDEAVEGGEGDGRRGEDVEQGMK